jgi:two-component system response regulator DevR
MTDVRIMLVDDHEVVRLGLRALLERQPGWRVVAEAGTAMEAVTQARAHHPDVIVMDIRLPDASGIEACRQIKAEQPDTQVIMLTSYAEDEMLFDAIRAGAAGYILKQIGSTDLIRAISAVARGEALLDPAITARVLERMRAAEVEISPFAELSQQEMRVLALIAEGKTNREIAQAVFLSEKTVRNYVSNILSKLHLANRAEAAAYAVRHRLRDYLSTLP